MPFISEAASAIKTRFGFQNPSESVRATPDISKSTSRENLSQSSTVSSLSDVDEGRAGNSEIAVRSFDLPEDPAFWKDHSVQVIIRTRPLSSSEISLQGDNRCVRQESYQTIAWTGHPESRFTFDLVADENVTQEKLFKVVGIPMVENCMSGYNSCMFAYGQTGSGKTHTMLGDIEGGTRRHSVNCGMTPRVFEYLFSRIQKEKEARRDEKLRFTCKCSFLEIYNEQILDLLNPSSVNLQIREDLKKGVYVEGLTESEVTCAREVLQQLIQGSANRKVAATNMNRASSRSHSVFTCVIESTWDSQGVTHHRFARLNLVDLAGSERQKSSGAEGERFKEATNINKSLSTLGLVIMNLVSISNGKSLHVPYRDSKLTFLLQDSLGGNSKTTIIANISPSNCSSLETLSTLKFAQRAKFIKNNAIVNEDASGDVLVMRMQIQQLKKEVSRLRGIVNGGAENQDDDTLSLGFPGSPESFKWEGLCGTFSPFNSDRKASQKEYEVALVGAFRREKDKDLALQALATENQAAMQLAKQREDEIRGLKMRLRFREAGIKRLEAMASGKISAETHFLKEKEEHLKEIEVLRAQVDRNQEVTRFAMENLRLKEEIRRLKSFCEEGERERMNEQIMVLQNKLLEALDWKFMHESDPSAIQKGSPGLLTEGHHNSEQSNEEQASPWQASINEENELFHLQAIQNQAEMDFLRKKLDLCMEEKQKLERHIKELETEVEIMRSSKPMEKTQKVESDIPERANDMYSISFNDQMELKAMVDAIAAASEREAEAHEVAISLSKKNDELQSKVKVLLQENNKLIDLYEQAIADQNDSSDRIAHGGGNEIQNTTSFDANSDDKDMESKKLEDLEHQLMEMHEENEKLMGLYEKAMQERDEFKRMLSSRSEYDVKDKGEFNCPEKLVVVDGGEYFESDELAVNKGECMQSDEPSFNGGAQISEENDVFRWNMQNDSDQFLETARPTEEVHMDLNSDQSHDNFTGESFYEPSTTNLGPPFSRETGLLAEDTVFSQLSEMDGSGKYLLHSHDNPDKLENLRITSELEAKKELALVVKMKLDEAQEKLSNSAQNVNEFGFLEKAILDVGELSRVIEGMKDLIHLREQELESHKLFSSEMQEKSALAGRKLLALKYALSNFSSPIAYFEQREVRARARADASKSYANQKREDLARLQAQKDEIEAARNKIQEGEIELRNNLANLKSKLEEENQRQENQKVLFSLDNVERAEIHLVHKSGKHGCKATELLKSEEEKTKLLNEIKHSRDKLGIMKKEIEDLNKNSQKAENKIQGASMEVHKASKDVEEMELALNNIAHEKEILLEIGEDGKTQIDNMIIEYQECMFAAYLKEEESKILEEEMQTVLAELERLQTEKAAIINRTSQLLHGRECHAFSLSDNMQEVLEDVGRSILEAKLLLEQGS
ncbi:hypothetical protein Nepgr_000224 [Nepenthes gracilis]|uniref:Kinesin motor domain-containing protein n=1 Tax=Nepenthes gracilis TaxID=150966 RepID=A0AAD3RWI3_NEPGR|nr:hypothetical protein Nepgr_000224 [Nepenthes gracilis]